MGRRCFDPLLMQPLCFAGRVFITNHEPLMAILEERTKPGQIQSPSQARFPGLSPWGEVGGIASSLCSKATLPQLILT